MSQFRLETELDMAGYLDIDFGHGVSAVFTNSGGTSTTINIILNNEYVEQEEGIGVEALKPVAYCRTIDIPSIGFGNRLDVSAIKDVNGNILKAAQNYTVVNIQSDRTGFSALMLEEI
jgi:hypothetical protein|tara:strand:- start:519 stop:872 length:354 start_codon:yes stop_codon:yes gene_type:complete